MSHSSVGITRVALSFILAGLTFAAVAEQRTVAVSDLARCRAIVGAGERLACYDTLEARAVAGIQNSAATPTESASSRTAAAGGEVQSAQAPAGAPAATVASTGVGAPTGAGAAAPATAPTATGAATAPDGATAAGATAAAAPRSPDLDDPANFGLSLHQLRPAAAVKGPGQIKSVVSRMTQDRLNNVDLVLDNGQTWRLVESDPRVRPGDTVSIKRAALGSYLLVTPSRRSYRVERTN